MLPSQCATGSPANQMALAGQINHCKWQFFTHNSSIEAVIDLLSEKASLPKNFQLRTPQLTLRKFKKKSFSIVYTDPEPQKF